MLNITPVFIVGNSRSGTTLLSRILKNHSCVHTIPHELHLFDEFKSKNKGGKVIGKEKSILLLSQIKLRANEGYFHSEFSDKYSSSAKEVLNGFECEDYDFASILKIFFKECAATNKKKIVCEQTPRNLFYIGEILDIFPNAKFVNLVRDPRGVLLSQKNKWKACIRFKQPRKEAFRAFINYHPFNIIALWKKCVRVGHINTQKYPDNVLTVNFDDFSQDPSQHLKQICQFIGVEFVPELLEIEVEMSSNLKKEGSKGIDQEISNTWQEKLSSTEIYLAEKLCKNELSQHNYPFINKSPNFLHIAWLFLYWPISTFLALTLNGNFFKKINVIGKRT